MKSVPLYLSQGSVVFCFGSRHEAETAHAEVRDAYKTGEPFRGFTLRQREADLPWLIGKSNAVIVGLAGLPAGYRPDSTLFITEWPPVVAGNEVLNFGLAGLRAQAVTVRIPAQIVTFRAAA